MVHSSRVHSALRPTFSFGLARVSRLVAVWLNRVCGASKAGVGMVLLIDVSL